MKAMILAAGFGRRMLPLTERLPKPMLTVQEKPLIAYHVSRLVAAGVRELVINVGHLGHIIVDYLGDGEAFGANIQYSCEPPDAPLETAGGVMKALPLLGSEPFLLVNGDLWTDFPFEQLKALRTDALFHGAVILPPDHHPKGDFCLSDDGRLTEREGVRVVFSGISRIDPGLFRLPVAQDKEKLRSWIYAAMAKGQASGALFSGEWVDVGTPQRLQELDLAVAARARANEGVSPDGVA